jgi:hypothetical protein
MDMVTASDKPRTKTSLRMRYEAEARVWLEGRGGLEGIRGLLGLSQRKMCQLLLVDPSAWTRWMKNPHMVPPHVVRSLQWYWELQQKNPAWAEWRELFLKKQADPAPRHWQKDIEKRISEIQFQPSTSHLDWANELGQLKDENLRLNQQIERQTTISMGWKMVLLFNTVWILFSIIKGLL